MKGLFGILLLVGIVLVYWQWVLAIIVVVLIVKAAPVAYREFQAERADAAQRYNELVARADQQHRWAMSGDARGVYGAFPPAVQ